MLLKQVLIVVLLFYYYKIGQCANSPLKSKRKIGKPLHKHGTCKLAINKLLLSAKGHSFVEIAKLCRKTAKVDPRTQLKGYAVLVYRNFEDQIQCIQGSKLSNRVLINPDPLLAESVPEAVQPASHASRGMQGLRNQHNYRNIPGKPQQQVDMETSSQQQSNVESSLSLLSHSSLQNTNQDIALLKLPNSDSSSRHKRDSSYTTQSDAKMFYSVDLPSLSYFKDGTVVVVLLHIHAKAERRKLPCTIGKTVTDEEISESQKWLYDILVISTQRDSDNFNNLKNFIHLLTSETDLSSTLRNVIIPHVQSGVNLGIEYSYSKCDNDPKPKVAIGFKLSPPTKNMPNMCKTSGLFILRPMCSFPFTFTGSNFKPQSNKLILNLIASLEFYKNNREIMKENSKQLAAKLLNIGTSSVYRAESRHKNNEIDIPPKKRQRTSEILDFMDDDNRRLLRSVITNFYGQNQVPTVTMLHTKFMAEARLRQLQALQKQGPVPENEKVAELFKCSQPTFRLLLHKLGYKFGALNHRYSVLFSPEKVRWRQRYIRRIQEIRKTGEKEIIFLDETWWDPNQIPKKGWMPKSCNDPREKKEFSYKTVKPGRGPRIIILAAGGKKFGFIPGSSKVWSISAKHSDQDYHGNIGQTLFEKWFQELLINIEKLSSKAFLIVMDNAQYHSVITAPKQSARKQEIIEFLRLEKEKGKDVPDNFETMLAVELKQVLKKIKKDNNYYKLDALTRKKGHEVLRLPPYNCDMSPIEEVWKDIKYKLTQENKLQNIDLQVESAKRALMCYEKDKWASHDRHIRTIEQQYIDSDAKFDAALDNNPEIQLNDEVNEDNTFDNDEENDTLESESEDEVSEDETLISNDEHNEEREPEPSFKKQRV